MHRRIAALVVAAVLMAVMALLVSDGTADEPAVVKSFIDFNREIRPILSENCFKCHGPDDKQRKGKLRLDTREGALEHATAIVPGRADDSQLISRITAHDDDLRMPPVKTDKRLTAQQIESLRQWINQGAKWTDHWAFIPPKRPPIPFSGDSQSRAWHRNPIDYFVFAKLQAAGLQPFPEADTTTLIRRVTLDLTGLPPTPAEVDAFLADNSPTAYETVVDRLLASPRFGERLALEWLDAARYADTHGYHIDSGRDMTRWRAWVINAFNQDMPFDQFTVEQLAGDLLPNATTDQKIASGFNRNHMINFEGGAIPEEYHAAYIMDRVNTTGTVWLGLTVGCAQCHDHKYDPISQKEYYQLYAFFHNLPESGLDGAKGNAAPMLKLPTRKQQQKLEQLTTNIKDLESKLNSPLPEIDLAQAEWEQAAIEVKKVDWTILDPSETTSKGGAEMKKLDDKAILVTGANPAKDTYTITATVALKDITAFRLETLVDDGLVAKGPGRSINGNIVMTDVKVSVVLPSPPGGEGPGVRGLKLKTATADFSQKDFPVTNAIDDKPNTGWALLPEFGKPHFAVFEFAEPIKGDESITLTITLDFQSQFGQHQLGKFRLAVTDAKEPHEANKLPANITALLNTESEKRTDPQKNELRAYYRKNISEAAKKLYAQVDSLRKEQGAVDTQIPSAMVMQEMPKPRDTFTLIRGQYDKKGEKVTAAVPAFLPPLQAHGSQSVGSSRLDLARWLVDPAHPLTARVIVNRYWQMYFGTGLVKTAEDFGAQGEWPTHPELLDWLATEFMHPSTHQTGWNVKHLHRLIVTSATYRQSARVAPEHLAKDAENRLLARAPRLRLQAEFIRDQALAVSGLLNGEIGGKSVSPYQPAGLWEELTFRQDNKNWTAQTYEQSKGIDLYRRTMYTFWKRTSPPPTLMTFDAPDRETCTVRRPRTNTPLQALVLLNDPTYVEASRKLAERLMIETETIEDRITLAFRLATARRPSEAELAVLVRLFKTQLVRYRQDAAAAQKLLAVGESNRNEKLDAAELAAWTMVASAILNLDETVTRG